MFTENLKSCSITRKICHLHQIRQIKTHTQNKKLYISVFMCMHIHTLKRKIFEKMLNKIIKN